MSTKLIFTGNAFVATMIALIATASPGDARAKDESAATSWRLVRSIAAPEAVQAAAADEKNVYAVTNGQIARYDRENGRRLGASIGPAKHLNSAFLWKGKLYAAHSNYPQKPEVSEIKILDPESMKLTTFHDFADFGGSLTWCVRHDDAWWCHFAHYGADNAKSFLVKFDDEWKERGRWTYPGELVREWGQYSLSGGVWHNDELLTTGHDDPILFRLQLPKEGAVMRFLGRSQVPFTGQGIAVDPLTGGLVGISRARRQALFAEPVSATPAQKPAPN